MSASSAPVNRGAQSSPSSVTTTLRSLLDGRRNEGRRFSLDEAVATIVPICLDLKERHDRRERIHVHPSCVAPGADARHLDHAGRCGVAGRLSLLPPEEIAPAPVIPPAPRAAQLDPFGAPLSAPASAPRSATVAEQLAALKAHLESDPRPRYVVN